MQHQATVVLVAKARLKLTMNFSGKERRKARFNIRFFKKIQDKFRLHLSNRFELLQEHIN